MMVSLGQDVAGLLGWPRCLVPGLLLSTSSDRKSHVQCPGPEQVNEKMLKELSHHKACHLSLRVYMQLLLLTDLHACI